MKSYFLKLLTNLSYIKELNCRICLKFYKILLITRNGVFQEFEGIQIESTWRNSSDEKNKKFLEKGSLKGTMLILSNRMLNVPWISLWTFVTLRKGTGFRLDDRYQVGAQPTRNENVSLRIDLDRTVVGYGRQGVCSPRFLSRWRYST